MNFIEIAQHGFDEWAAKPHNAKWAKMILHTPIPNDLTVCIAMAFSEAMRQGEPQLRDHVTGDLPGVDLAELFREEAP